MMEVINYFNLGAVLGLIGFMWKLSESNRKKVSYDSWDRFKDEIKNDYRTKEVCEIYIKEIKEDFKEAKERLNKIDEIIADIREIKVYIKNNGRK